MSRGVLSKAIGLYRELGLLRATLYLQTRLPLHGVFEIGLQQIVSLNLESLSPRCAESPRVREATRSDKPLLTGFGSEPRSIEAFFDRGYRVWIIEESGTLVAYDWLATSRKRFWKVVDLVVGERDLWHWHYEVAGTHRGHGIGTEIRAHVAEACRRDGYARLLGNYEPGNKSSQRVLEKLGYRPLRWLVFIRLWRWKLVFFGWRVFFGRWAGDDRLELEIGS